MERENDPRAAAVLEELGAAQSSAVCSWRCGNSDRASNDQDKVDRAMELELAAGKGGTEDRGGIRGGQSGNFTQCN